MTNISLNLSGRLEYNKGKTVTVVNLNIVQFKDNDVEVLYAPALEVYGYGETFEESLQSLQVCLAEFLVYTRNKGTFESELIRLGWIIKGRKNARKYKTPMFSELLTSNPNLVDIINNKQITTYNAELPVATA